MKETAIVKNTTIHNGERVLQLSREQNISVPMMAKWFNVEHSNMYAKLKISDWRMSDILTAAGHLNVSPLELMGENFSGTRQPLTAHEPASEYQSEVKMLRKENSMLKDKIIKLLEKK